ncbi:PAS domain-containing protein [Streptomyces griseocarneus]|uniref:PAS domain-containing protein n=1 Tax=Streptomyces griseocarneus TaxID=51201 RepID=UPI003D6CCCB4
MPRTEAERLTAALRQVLDTGKPMADIQLVGPVPGHSERRRWSVSLYRLHSGSGRPIGVAAIATDVTGRRRAEREAAGVRRNLALLNEAGARIGNSLDLETTARELLDVAVPQFCDLASVDLYQGLLVGDEAPPGLADGSAELRRVAYSSAVSGAPLDEADSKPIQVGEVHRYPFHSPCAQALRTAHVQVVPGREGDDGPSWAPSCSPPSPCRWSPATRSWASRSSPAPRAASPSVNATPPWPSSSPPARPSASTTPGSTAASTNAP